MLKPLFPHLDSLLKMVSEKTEIAQDTLLIGIGASRGIAIGETFQVDRARMVTVERRIAREEIAGEVDSFMEALQASKQQLEEVKAAVSDAELAEHLYIIDTHLLILDDQMLVDDTIAVIRNELINAEGALKRTLDKFRQVFDRIEDEYLRDRRTDIDSIGERLMRNLMGQTQQSLSDIDRKAIVVAHDLSPADTMQMNRDKIIGFVTDVGGRTSHTAILARSMGIPAVIGMETISTIASRGTRIIIDGSSGVVILNPSEETLQAYREKKAAYENRQIEYLAYSDLPAETIDGHRVVLRGNVELADEVPQAQKYGAEGVGLFRSEFLFLNRPVPPSEDEQAEGYRAVVEAMAPHSVTIRTLDLGGDKFVPELNLGGELNPAMGLRAVRFSLKERRLFKTQLRAILRASAFGQVRIMFPMISGIGEINDCKAILAEARKELTEEGVPFDAQMPIGIMIEIPSAAIVADMLASEVDFFSVGTNDLIQYLLAVDRGNEHVAYLYEPLHPAVLRALRSICRAARDAGIPVSMCGEMAADPFYTQVLLGLGFNELSMNPPDVPRVKQILRQTTWQQAERLLQDLLRLKTASEASRYLENEMVSRFPEVFDAPFS